jgi:hypothetical protein
VLRPSFETHRSRDAPQDEVRNAAQSSQAHQNLPDGQITFARGILSSPLCKNISVPFEGKSPAY